MRSAGLGISGHVRRLWGIGWRRRACGGPAQAVKSSPHSRRRNTGDGLWRTGNPFSNNGHSLLTLLLGLMIGFQSDLRFFLQSRSFLSDLDRKFSGILASDRGLMEKLEPKIPAGYKTDQRYRQS
jgi:hypothetical protein